jgi:hypothetical protein
VKPALLLVALAACQPWYRDDLRAGQRAQDPRWSDATMAEAATAAETDPARASALVRQVVERDPLASSSVYVTYARYLVAAGRPAAARAVLQFRIDSLEAGEGSGDLQTAIVDAYVADDLTADALDHLGSSDASSYGSLQVVFADLLRADAGGNSVEAIMGLRAFEDSYGCPDHPWIAAKVASIQDDLAAIVPALAALPDRADAALAAGDAKTARLLFAEAYRVLPAALLLDHRAGFALAARAATDPATDDPIAYAYATAGDDAIRAHHLGPAIHAYRRAVAEAPWWRAAHENLALLYELDGRADAAAAERAFVAAFLP